MIWFACKKCGKRLSRPEGQAGSMVFCDCGQGNRVPWSDAPAADAPPEPVPVPIPAPRPRPGAPRLPSGAVPVPLPEALPASAPVPAPARPGPGAPQLGPKRPALLGKVNPNFCFAHDELPREETCTACKLPFCKACVVLVEEELLCGPCKNFRLATLSRPARVLPQATVALVVALVVAPVSFVLSLVAAGLGVGEGLFVAPVLLVGVALAGPGLGVLMASRALRQLEARADGGGRGRAMGGLCVALVAGVWCLGCLALLIARNFLAA